jgi:hypothetical protein
MIFDSTWDYTSVLPPRALGAMLNTVWNPLETISKPLSWFSIWKRKDYFIISNKSEHFPKRNGYIAVVKRAPAINCCAYLKKNKLFESTLTVTLFQWCDAGKIQNEIEQLYAVGRRQYSHSWFRIPSRPMTKFLFAWRPLVSFEMGPLLRREEGLVFLGRRHISSTTIQWVYSHSQSVQVKHFHTMDIIHTLSLYYTK